MPENNGNIRPVIPASVSSLMAGRKNTNTVKSINDWFEEIHLILWENEEYRKWYEPIWREETIEASYIMDDSQIAGMVRQYAIDNRLPIHPNSLKLGVLHHSLSVLRNRYPALNRKLRQEQMGGSPVQHRRAGRLRPEEDASAEE